MREILNKLVKGFQPEITVDETLALIHSEMVGLVKGLDTFNILEEDDGVLTEHLLSAIEKKFGR